METCSKIGEIRWMDIVEIAYIVVILLNLKLKYVNYFKDKQDIKLIVSSIN